MSVNDLDALLRWLLTDATADLDVPPDWADISHGPPAVDFGVCSLLAVYLAGVTPRQLTSNPRVTENCAQVPQGRFGFEVWRCAPALPSGADEVTAASLAALANACAIWNGITQRRGDGTLLPPGPPAITAMVSMTPVGPQGGMAGWQILLDVELSRPFTPPAS